MNKFLQDVVLGPPCPFARDQKAQAHPTVEQIEPVPGRRVLVCRHCGLELANQPSLPLLEEPRETDPRIRMAELNA